MCNYLKTIVIFMKDKVRMWPTEFDGKSIRLQDVTRKWWTIRIRVKSVSNDITGDWTSKKEVFCKQFKKYIIVYNLILSPSSMMS